jgi:hypothetical protein
MKLTDWIVALASVAGVVVAAIYTGITRGLWKAQRTAVELTEKSLNAQKLALDLTEKSLEQTRQSVEIARQQAEEARTPKLGFDVAMLIQGQQMERCLLYTLELDVRNFGGGLAGSVNVDISSASGFIHHECHVGDLQAGQSRKFPFTDQLDGEAAKKYICELYKPGQIEVDLAVVYEAKPDEVQSLSKSIFVTLDGPSTARLKGWSQMHAPKS